MDNKSVLYQLMDTRMGEALHKITKEDAVFIQSKERADDYAAKLASLNLSEETMRLIALGRGNNCDAETLQDSGQLVSAGVDTQAGLGDTAQAADDLFLAGKVLQLDAEAGSVAVKERHQPRVLVETAGLSEEEWLAYRRKGIGGSDVAALLGISPWRTARDLFYDKLNIAVVEDHEDNWVALEMGHLLEPLVAKIFQHRTGYKIYQIKKMFQHPKYPWMLADVDYFVELPDGTTAILEIKTTNYNAKDNWWLDGEETIPAYYESQGRHYMAVMDVDRCFFCCLYGNNEQESIIRDMQRDLSYEDEMIFLEQNFWENHVLTRTPPPYTEDGDLVIESVRRYTGPADKEAPAVSLDLSLTAKLMRFLQLQEQKKGAEAGKKEIEEDMKRLKAAIIAKMGKSCKAICQQDGVNYTVTYNPIRTPGIDKDNLKRLKLDHPDIYEQYVTVSVSRRFVVKCDGEAA